MVAVIATFDVAAGQEAAFEAEFKTLQSAVRANEAGNSLYILVRGKKQPNIFKVLETYDSKDAFKAHGASAWFQESFGKMKPLLASDPVIELFDPVA